MQKKVIAPKKILLITWNLEPYSGWGRYSFDLVNALREKGVDVTVECISNPLDFKKHILFSWWSARQIQRKYKEQKFDLVHCAVEPYAEIARLLSRRMVVPYAVTLHGSYSVVLLRHPVYSYFQREAYKGAKKLIAVSHYTASRVREIINAENLAVIPNGYTGPIAPSPRTLSSPKILMGIGAIKRRKGYHLAIEALATIKEDIRPFKYYIVGSGDDMEYENYLKSLIKKYHLEKEVILTGKLPEEELKKLFDVCHLFVLTPISEGDYFEGFGLVYLEANAKSIPVIAMKGSGVEDAVKDGSSGLLAEKDDVSDLAMEIKRVLTDDGRYARLSTGAIEWAGNMQWENIVTRYLEEY